jgi:apolipoprotein N-acyltransferase
MALLFPLLKLALILFPQKGYFLQWLLWLAYEYLRTLGFLGFPYGITGYSQWQYPTLIGIASIFGVWGVSALVLFPSVYLGAAKSTVFFYRERLAAAVWLGALGAALVFGHIQINYTDSGQKETANTAKIALIQQNADPWKSNNYDSHKQTLRTLIALSNKALEEEPDADLVVWPETAFIPRIYWHLTYRDNPAAYEVVKELMDYLARQRVPFLIGNDDARLEVSGSGRWERVDYNAALLFEGDNIKAVYRKNHLVPFAEHFPYEKHFPRIYKILLEADPHFWKPGTEPTVFKTGHLLFSAPICFEDCFGYISWNFARLGAQFIVNLSNDAWAGSLSCQNQHLSMAVLRAVENNRSLVRSTTSGQTCAISPRGKILAMVPPFTETALTVEIPLLTSRTPYAFWGDLWGILFSILALLLLLTGIIRFILGIIKIGRKQ